MSFGELGEKGDLFEIHYSCKLIQEFLNQIIVLEESVYFVHVPEECDIAVGLFRNLMGSQAMKLSALPKMLDEVVELAISEDTVDSEEPKVIRKVITLELPETWSSDLTNEMKKDIWNN